MPDRSRDGRYSLPGEIDRHDPASGGRIGAALPAANVHAEIVVEKSTGILALDTAIRDIEGLRARVAVLEANLYSLQQAKERDSQHQLETALEEANTLLAKRDEAARHWTRWAAQILVSLIIGAVLLILGKYLGAKH